MSNHKICPECGSTDTKMAFTERYGDEIQDVWKCESCPTQWNVTWGEPLVSNVRLEA